MGWFRKKPAASPAAEKLAFLRRYTLGRGDLDVLDGPPDASAPVPELWRILHALPPRDRVAAALGPWRTTVGDRLGNTIGYLAAYATDVEVMRLGDASFLLYTIQNRHGLVQYYAGGNPLVPRFPDKGGIQARWAEVPQPLRSFYETVHDGFYHFPSRALGLEALENVTCTDTWDVHFDMGVDLNSTYPFFSNMMGSYVVVDLSDCADDKATLWWHADPPENGIRFWDVVDEWIVIGFEP